MVQKNQNNKSFESKYKVGDLVWAKFENCPYWPSRIAAKNIADALRENKGEYNKECVLFFGDSHTYGLVESKFIVDFNEGYDEYNLVNSKTEYPDFQRAVAQAKVSSTIADPHLEIESPSHKVKRSKNNNEEVITVWPEGRLFGEKKQDTENIKSDKKAPSKIVDEPKTVMITEAEDNTEGKDLVSKKDTEKDSKENIEKGVVKEEVKNEAASKDLEAVKSVIEDSVKGETEKKEIKGDSEKEEAVKEETPVVTSQEKVEEKIEKAEEVKADLTKAVEEVAKAVEEVKANVAEQKKEDVKSAEETKVETSEPEKTFEQLEEEKALKEKTENSKN